MRYPTDNISDIKDSIVDIISTLNDYPKFEIKTVDIKSVASATYELIVTTNLPTILGAIQINSTTVEQPVIQYKDSKSVKVKYVFGATTSGKQTMTFLLIGR